MLNEYMLIQKIPSVDEYLNIRKLVGLPDNLNPESAEKGLSSSLFSVCVHHKNQVVGFGRVVGDGGIYYYIQDVFVHPDHQNKGCGKRIMDAIMNYFAGELTRGVFIGLMAAEGVTGFYEKYGFVRRNTDRPGMYKIWEE